MVDDETPEPLKNKKLMRLAILCAAVVQPMWVSAGQDTDKVGWGVRHPTILVYLVPYN